MLIGAMTLMLL